MSCLKVAEALSLTHSNVQKGVMEIMGGQVLDYETKVIYRQGLQQGIESRDNQKITEMLRNGKLPEEIADFCGYPLEQVKSIADDLNKLK